ncbi:hypothetical protein SpAn4DRAFT_0316 [Sporomusa ovata]|uniref:Uncharacterized protein n=1 Tax=Sporomusa ovata TaxID=2378 RepID=A0A0U1L4P6_9FIRM|nr:hypothetical protein SpAn4DRAFT_0316 [Sporomusa ovata]
MTTGVIKKNKKSVVIPMNMECGGFFVFSIAYAIHQNEVIS